MMDSVVVGIFDSQTAASEARGKLIDAGFAASAVTMTDQAANASPANRPADANAGKPEEEGAISHFFRSIFGDDDDSGGDGHTYREAIRRGAYGISVRATSEDEVDKAEMVLNDCGAVDIDERSEQWRSEGWKSDDAVRQGEPTAYGAVEHREPMAYGAVAQGESMADGDTRKVNVVEEELKVGKRAVARGGVRVHSRVVEVPVEESVKLREEHVDVERRAVDRPATEADFEAFKEGSIEVRETSEEAVVSKNARVVGEVEIGKTVTEKDETVRDTVRKTEVDVEKIDAKAASTNLNK